MSMITLNRLVNDLVWIGKDVYAYSSARIVPIRLVRKKR